MTITIALDISSKHVGYSIWRGTELLDYGVINPPLDAEPHQKLNYIEGVLHTLVTEYKVTDALIEAPLKYFSSGGSSAQTLMLLSNINFGVQHFLQGLKIKTELIACNTARSKCGLHFAKGTTAKQKKDIVRSHVLAAYPSLLLPLSSRTGNYHVTSYDIADSILLMLSTFGDQS